MTWPIPYVEENQPPELLAPFEDEGEPVVVDRAMSAWIIVTDDVDEMPMFVWQVGPELLPDEPQRNEDEAGFVTFMSTAALPYDPELDGEELDVTVSDGHGGRLELTWPLEVL